MRRNQKSQDEKNNVIKVLINKDGEELDVSDLNLKYDNVDYYGDIVFFLMKTVISLNETIEKFKK